MTPFEQLRSLLDAARRHSSRPPPDTEGWFAQGEKIWVRVGTNSFGHPDFEWRDLPTYMLHEHESRAAEFVLDARAVERILGQRFGHAAADIAREISAQGRSRTIHSCQYSPISRRHRSRLSMLSTTDWPPRATIMPASISTRTTAPT